jgi:hypothetical protein
MFAPGTVHVGYVEDKVALEEDFLRVLPFFPENIIPLRLSILTIWELNNRPAGGQSSETQSRPIVMNNEQLPTYGTKERIYITFKLFYKF